MAPKIKHHNTFIKLIFTDRRTLQFAELLSELKIWFCMWKMDMRLWGYQSVYKKKIGCFSLILICFSCKVLKSNALSFGRFISTITLKFKIPAFPFWVKYLIFCIKAKASFLVSLHLQEISFYILRKLLQFNGILIDTKELTQYVNND